VGGEEVVRVHVEWLAVLRDPLLHHRVRVLRQGHSHLPKRVEQWLNRPAIRNDRTTYLWKEVLRRGRESAGQHGVLRLGWRQERTPHRRLHALRRSARLG
jgi:hypothetical protein